MKSKSLIAILLLLFFMNMNVYGLLLQKEYKFRQVSLNQGLSQSTVNSIVQDKNGFIWLGTEGGLNRYDGNNVKVFRPSIKDTATLSNSWITALEIDDDGFIWVGTLGGGVNRFDPVTEKVIRYRFNPADSLGLPSDEIWDISKGKDGKIWVATNGGVAVYEPKNKKFRHFQFPDYKNFMLTFQESHVVHEDSDGGIWVGFAQLGLVYYNIKDGTIQSKLSNGVEITAEASVYRLYEDSSRRIWVSTTRSGVFVFENGSISRNLTKKEGLASQIVTGIDEDTKGNIWLSMNGGFAKIQPPEYLVENYTSKSENIKGLSVDFFYTIYVDKSDNLWLGSSAEGVMVADLKPRKFRAIDFGTHPNGDAVFRMIWDFYETDSGHVFIASQGGLVELDSTLKTIQVWPANHVVRGGLKGLGVYSIAEHKDDLFLATGEGIFVRFSPQTGVSEIIPLSTGELDQVTGIVDVNKIGENEVLLSSFAGLYRYGLENGKLTKVNLSNSAYQSSESVLSVVVVNDENIWVVTNRGVFNYNANSRQAEKINLNPEYLNHLGTIRDDGRFLWLTSSMGLIRYDKETENIDLYDEKSGFYSPNLFSIELVSPGHLWVGTAQGLARIVYSMSSPDSVFIRSYQSSDGLFNLEYNQGANIVRKNGQVLMGGTRGVDIIDPEIIYDNPHKPGLAITSYYTIQETVRRSFNALNKQAVSLPYNTEVLGIDVVALEFTQPELNTYSYRLKGFETGWHTTREKPFIVYTSLSPGDYALELRAANNDGVWSDKTEILAITIIPPFWRTYWFYSVSGLFSVFVLIGFVKIRERTLKRQKNNLEKEVDKQTRELREREHVFRMISENALDLICILDGEGHYMYASPSHNLIMGYTSEYLSGKNFFGLVHNEDSEDLKSKWSVLKEQGQVILSDYRMQTADGSYRVYHSTGSRVSDGKSNIDRFVVISHDVSEQRAITEQLKKSKDEAEMASRSKSAFLASMSHELKTPLNSIIGFSQILSGESNLSDRQIGYVDTIYESGAHLLEMINEIMDLSKIEAGRIFNEPVDFDLEILIKELQSRFHRWNMNKYLKFDFELNMDSIPVLNADYDKILRISSHILNNAAKFTSEGGIYVQVWLNSGFRKVVKPKNPNLSEIFFEKEGESKSDKRQFLHIVIGDSGNGIDKEKVRSIFKPFQQSDPNFSAGMGLGLSVSWRFLHLLGGRLKVFSKPGEGTEFHLFVPVQASASKQNLGAFKVSLHVQDSVNKSLVYINSDSLQDRTILSWIEEAGFKVFPMHIKQVESLSLKALQPNLILVSNGGLQGSVEKILDELGQNGKNIAVIIDKNQTINIVDAHAIQLRSADEIVTDLAHVLGVEVDSAIASVTTSSENEDIISLLGKLESPFHEELLDALEIMDLNKLRSLSELLPNEVEFDQLRAAISQNDYSFLINLNEKL